MFIYDCAMFEKMCNFLNNDRYRTKYVDILNRINRYNVLIEIVCEIRLFPYGNFAFLISALVNPKKNLIDCKSR